MRETGTRETDAFGPNAWLVDEMFEQYQRDPASVSESWREFFADYTPGPGTPVPPAPVEAAPAAGPSRSEAPAPIRAPAAPDGDPVPLRGAAARVVSNMAASLGVPTAT